MGDKQKAACLAEPQNRFSLFRWRAAALGDYGMVILPSQTTQETFSPLRAKTGQLLLH